jgi:hypothetical protein
VQDRSPPGGIVAFAWIAGWVPLLIEAPTRTDPIQSEYLNSYNAGNEDQCGLRTSPLLQDRRSAGHIKGKQVTCPPMCDPFRQDRANRAAKIAGCGANP